MNRRTIGRAARRSFLAAALLVVAASAHAQAPAGESAIPPGEIPEVLKARVGKSVTLLLSSGKEYGGTVGEVRGQSVVLRSIAGKEFYDAIVRIEDVTAIEIRRDR